MMGLPAVTSEVLCSILLPFKYPKQDMPAYSGQSQLPLCMLTPQGLIERIKVDSHQVESGRDS